ncbi:MAG: carbohydrate ABC transporter permease [Treponema sp.]|jgi:ABC-type glycerol-3-phosphate transport system permease component|nr:carbohydrate ABC transporter permease [Treponema sp.]
MITHIAKQSFAIRFIILRIFKILIFMLMTFFTLMPIMWGIITSFKGKRDVYAYPPKFFNFNGTFENYRTIIEGGYLRTFNNSIFYSLVSVIFGLFIGMIAAYALQRCRFPFRRIFFYLVIAGIPLSIGSAALLIPNYLYMSVLGFIDRPFTLIIMYTAYNLPMAIWVIKGGIETIPLEIEEAAAIDGCSRRYIIFHLVPVLNRPAMVSAALLIFIGVWNEFILASVMINSSNLRPVQQSIYHHMGFFGLDWGLLTASTSLAVIPTIIIFSFLSKLLVSGLTQGSVKG